MRHLGKVKPGSTLYLYFDTFDGGTGASITMSGLAAADIEIYKDGGTTQRASDTGYTLLDTDGIDFDGVTGIHGVSIDLSSNADANFYEAGSHYVVVVSSITVDAQTVSFILADFTIGYEGAVLDTTIATLSTQTSFTLEEGPAEDDALNGCVVVIHDLASAVQAGFAVVSDYTGSSKTVTLTAGTTFTAAAGDNISFFSPVNVAYAAQVAWASGAITAGAIATGAIDADAIADNAIDAGAIATGAITSAKFAAGAIDAAAIATDAIGAAELADGAITAATFAAGAIDATAIATGAIDADAIAADAITAAKIADGAIDANTFAAGAITASAIAADAIGSSEIADGAITAAKIATDAIDADALADGAITAATFAAGAIDATAIAANAIGASELAADAVAEIADAVWDEVMTNHATVNTFGQVLHAVGLRRGEVNDAAATTTAFAVDGFTEATDDHFNGQVIVFTSGDCLGQARTIVDYTGATQTVTLGEALTDAPGDNDDFVLLPGDFGGGDLAKVVRLFVTILDQTTGQLDSGSLANGTITANSIASDAITAAKIADNAIDAGAIAADAITAAKIADGAIDANTFAAGAITASAIAADAIGASELAADAVTEIQSGLATAAALASVQSDTNDIQTRIPASLIAGMMDSTVSDMAGGVITSATFAAGAITASAIAANAIGSSEIADGAITAAKIATDAIDADSLAADAVTEIWAKAMSDLAAVPAINASVLDAINWMFCLSRNKLTQTSTTQTAFKDDGSTTLAASTHSDDGTTHTRGEFA